MNTVHILNMLAKYFFVLLFAHLAFGVSVRRGSSDAKNAHDDAIAAVVASRIGKEVVNYRLEELYVSGQEIEIYIIEFDYNSPATNLLESGTAVAYYLDNSTVSLASVAGFNRLPVNETELVAHKKLADDPDLNEVVDQAVTQAGYINNGYVLALQKKFEGYIEYYAEIELTSVVTNQTSFFLLRAYRADSGSITIETLLKYESAILGEKRIGITSYAQRNAFDNVVAAVVASKVGKEVVSYRLEELYVTGLEFEIFIMEYQYSSPTTKQLEWGTAIAYYTDNTTVALASVAGFNRGIPINDTAPEVKKRLDEPPLDEVISEIVDQTGLINQGYLIADRREYNGYVEYYSEIQLGSNFTNQTNFYTLRAYRSPEGALTIETLLEYDREVLG